MLKSIIIRTVDFCSRNALWVILAGVALGVVSEVLPADRALDRGWELARDLARHDDVTLRLTRAALTQQLKRLLTDSLHHGLALEGLGAHATWPAG